MSKIFLLTDYRGQFYSSTKYRGAAVNLDRLKEYFSQHNLELCTVPFSEIDFRNHSYCNCWVLYQSSEDPGLVYRSFIDDVIFGLHLQGARLIPGIEKLRAHHNKHFMEIMRDLHPLIEIKNIPTKRYGTYEDFQKEIKEIEKGDWVIKSSDSSKSRGVFHSGDIHILSRIVRKISHSFSWKNFRYFLEYLRTREMPRFISNHRNKFILQSYINGLQGDYRVVVYDKKFYVLYRANRANDFRASGSMRFNYNVKLPNGLLDYAKEVFESFNVPFIALDIGVKGDDFFLFEFQFLSFGQYTLERSKFFYYLDEGKWIKKHEEPDLEREIANSVSNYIKKNQ